MNHLSLFVLDFKKAVNGRLRSFPLLLPFILCLLLMFQLTAAVPLTLTQSVFISCNKHNGDQSYWGRIAGGVGCTNIYSNRTTNGGVADTNEEAPVDALVWLGDAVYLDKRSLLRGCTPTSELEVMRAKFVEQHGAPEYTRFRENCLRQRVGTNTRPRVLGVWDDHDMGKNDGGAEYEHKDAVQQFFLDFLDVAKDDPRRGRRGVYSFEAIPFRQGAIPTLDMHNPTQHSHSNRNTNKNTNTRKEENRDTSTNVTLASTQWGWMTALQRVYASPFCFILLDVRYFRDPVNATRSGDMLGEEQWEWLETRLREDLVGSHPTRGPSRCAITVIGSGVQIFLDEKVSENWGAFPKSRDRLLHLLRRHRVERVVFLSGDVHLGEIGMDTTRDAMLGLGYPILEATSSGLTHSSAKFIGLPTLIHVVFPTKRRVGVYVERNYGILQLTVNTETLENVSFQDMDQNFLEAHVNVTVTVHSIPQKGESVLRLTLPLAALTHKSGCHFLHARADKKSGFVWTTGNESCVGVEEASAFQYPSTTPAPPLTYMVSLLQWYFWPNRTLTQVVFDVLFTGVWLVMGVLVLVFCLRCGGRAWRKKRLQRPRAGSEHEMVDKSKQA